MALSDLSWPPSRNPLIESASRPIITRAWFQWLLSLIARVQQGAWIRASVALTEQNTSIATTSLIPVAVAGLYRVSIYIRVTTPGSVSSSILATISTTDGGIPVSQATTALTTNTTASVRSAVVILRADPGVPISYSTTYASNGAGEMEYSLDMVAEQIG